LALKLECETSKVKPYQHFVEMPNSSIRTDRPLEAAPEHAHGAMS